jgi:cytochrome P450
LLDLLMRADGEPLSDNERRDQVFTIIGAGPRRRWRNWAIERLVHTPNALTAATAKARGSGEQMPFLDAVVRETLRLRPPIVLVGRLIRQPLTPGQHHFPADTLIVPVIQSVHRQPDLYDDLESF